MYYAYCVSIISKNELFLLLCKAHVRYKEMSKYNMHFSYGNILTTTFFNVWKLLQ